MTINLVLNMTLTQVLEPLVLPRSRKYLQFPWFTLKRGTPLSNSEESKRAYYHSRVR